MQTNNFQQNELKYENKEKPKQTVFVFAKKMILLFWTLEIRRIQIEAFFFGSF